MLDGTSVGFELVGMADGAAVGTELVGAADGVAVGSGVTCALSLETRCEYWMDPTRAT